MVADVTNGDAAAKVARLPIWLGRRVMSLLGRNGSGELGINHRWINRLLTHIFSLEAGWLRHHQLPFGVSVVCVARRPQ